LSVFKADFVFQLVFLILVFVPYDPALFPIFSVLLFALHIKIFLKVLSGPVLYGGFVVSSGCPACLPARQGRAAHG
jgi:hypothetical protein